MIKIEEASLNRFWVKKGIVVERKRSLSVTCHSERSEESLCTMRSLTLFGMTKGVFALSIFFKKTSPWIYRGLVMLFCLRRSDLLAPLGQIASSGRWSFEFRILLARAWAGAWKQFRNWVRRECLRQWRRLRHCGSGSLSPHRFQHQRNRATFRQSGFAQRRFWKNGQSLEVF